MSFLGQKQDVAIAKQCQRFPGETVDKWKHLLSSVSEECNHDNLEKVKSSFYGLLDSVSIEEQLNYSKKIKEGLILLLTEQNGDCPQHVELCLKVLVEIHSFCMSRHPLQRAVGRILDSLSCKDAVRSLTSLRIGEVLELGRSCDLTINSLVPVASYLEALMENYTQGKLSLGGRIIEVISLFHNWIPSLMSISTSTHDTSSLTLVSKTLLLVLSKYTEDIKAHCRTSTVLSAGVFPGQGDFGEPFAASLQELMSWTWDILEDAGLSSSSELTLACGMLYCELMKLVYMEGEELSEACRTALIDVKEEVSPYHRLSNGAKISFLQGILSKLPHTVLLETSGIRGDPVELCLHQVVFGHLYSLFEIVVKPNLVYMESKALAQWIRVTRMMCDSGLVLSHKALCRELDGEGGNITSQLLYYIWNQWESPIEGVRHQVKDTFSSLLSVHKQLFQAGDVHRSFVSSLVVKVLTVDAFSKAKYTYGAVLLDFTSVSAFLDVRKDLPLELMEAMSHQILAPHAGEFWSKATQQHCAEKNDNSWKTVWINPLLDTLCGGDVVQKRFVTQYCISKSKMPSGSLQYMLEALGHRGQSHKGTGEEDILLAELVCLKALNTGELNAEHTTIIRRALQSGSNEIKVSGFRLLCENKQTTDPPSETAVELVLAFLPDNMSSQYPAFRQQIQTSLKHFMRQVIESGLAILRKSGPDTPKVHQLKAFLHRFVRLQFAYINPLVSFQRRTFALNNLSTLAKVLHFVKSDRCRVPSVVDGFYDIREHIGSSPSLRTALVLSLQDSFQQNRETALQLLLDLPLQYVVIEDIPTHVAWCFKLSCSPKAVDCTAAAFNWKLLIHRLSTVLPSLLDGLNNQLRAKFLDLLNGLQEKSDQNMAMFQYLPSKGRENPLKTPSATEGRQETTLHQEEASASSPKDVSSKVDTLFCLLDTLHLHRCVAMHSLTQASLHAPMYGVIEAISALLQSLKGSINAAPDIKVFYSSIIKECLLISEHCCPVVCNSSPEGFLPEVAEHEEEEELGLKKASRGEIGGPTGQSLLLCCWHTMKEVSLLFGFMAESLVGRDNSQKCLISMSELSQIGDFFTSLLGQARHRGALEMGYIGFEKFCTAVWSVPFSPSSLLDNTTPLKWVDTKLRSLQDTSSRSITRRSAGLPYYFQGILTSAPPTQTHPLLQRVMMSLMTTVRESKMDAIVGPTTLDVLPPTSLVPEPAPVHALNIMRSLVRDAKLAESILPFVEDVFIIAVNGISSLHWAIRNSSTMLFTALTARMFGVKTVKDEHKKENKVPSKKFFSQYVRLRSFLHEKLEGVVENMKNTQSDAVDPTVFPVLLTLSRLSPSPLDDDTSSTSLACFVPLVMKCSHSPMWKVRALAARTLVAITPIADPPHTARVFAEDAPPKDTPPKDTPPQDTPPKDTPPQNTFPRDTPPKGTPQDTPPKDTPPQDTPPKDTPPNDTPLDTPPNDTPPQDTPSQDTSNSNTISVILASLPNVFSSGISQNSLHGHILFLKEYTSEVFVGKSELAVTFNDITTLLGQVIKYQWLVSSANVCPVTRLDYIQTMLPLLQYVCNDDSRRLDSGLDDNLVLFARHLMEDVVAALSDSTSTSWLLVEVLAGESDLIATVCANRVELAVELRGFFTDLMKCGDLGCRIVLHSCESLEPLQWALPLILECMPSSIRDADKDTVCACLSIISKALDEKNDSCGVLSHEKLHSVIEDAIHLGQRGHIRNEVCMSVLTLLESYGRFVKMKGLLLTYDEISPILSVVKKVLFDDQVEELCVMSARVLASYWMSCVCGPNGIGRVEKQGDILSVFWHLCLQLLFSNLHAVREEAVKCVSQMEDYTASQQHTGSPPAKGTFPPHFPGVMATVAMCIVQSFSSCPSAGLKFLITELLQLTDCLPSMPTASEAPSPLFEEGPVNDYKEVLVVGGLLAESIVQLCLRHHELTDDAVKLYKEALIRLHSTSSTSHSCPSFRSKSKEYFSIILNQFIDLYLLQMAKNIQLADHSIKPVDELPHFTIDHLLFETLI